MTAPTGFPPATLEWLPLPVLETVFDHLSRKDLVNLTQVSKTLYGAATPRLYANVVYVNHQQSVCDLYPSREWGVVRKDTLSRFISLVTANPDLAKCIRRADLADVPVGFHQHLSGVVDHMSERVRYLTLPKDVPMPTNSFPRLTNVEVPCHGLYTLPSCVTLLWIDTDKYVTDASLECLVMFFHENQRHMQYIEELRFVGYSSGVSPAGVLLILPDVDVRFPRLKKLVVPLTGMTSAEDVNTLATTPVVDYSTLKEFEVVFAEEDTLDYQWLYVTQMWEWAMSRVPINASRVSITYQLAGAPEFNRLRAVALATLVRAFSRSPVQHARITMDIPELLLVEVVSVFEALQLWHLRTLDFRVTSVALLFTHHESMSLVMESSVALPLVDACGCAMCAQVCDLIHGASPEVVLFHTGRLLGEELQASLATVEGEVLGLPRPRADSPGALLHHLVGSSITPLLRSAFPLLQECSFCGVSYRARDNVLVPATPTPPPHYSTMVEPIRQMCQALGMVPGRNQRPKGSDECEPLAL